MKSLVRLASPVLAVALLTATGAAQQSPVPIRALTPPAAATKEPLRSIAQVRELRDGRVMVNALADQALLVFDPSLTNVAVIADTSGTTATAYPRFARLIPYLGDSTLFVEVNSRSILMIDPSGTFGRVMAPPRPQDFNYLTSGGPVGVDARGRLIYQGQLPFFTDMGCVPGATIAPRPAPADSIVVIRADFETRSVDTIGRVRATAFSSPRTTRDANCRVTSARYLVNPALPAVDAWTVTSDGVVAFVRGHDYHVDWVRADDAKRSSPKMPFDWRRLTDDDKQAKLDSARKLIDSLKAIGGYVMRSCPNSMSFNANPPSATGAAGSGGGSSSSVGRGGASGGGTVGAVSDGAPSGSPADCQTLSVTPVFPALSEMADYIPPIRANAAIPDLDGNIWILPTTSAAAKGGLLYDVVNSMGVLVERVQLPADRTIAGFGRGGVVYLAWREAPFRSFLEKVTVIRTAESNE